LNIQRFTAATSREALAKARMAFGDGTLILSNRPTATGVEVMATAEDALGSLPPPALAPRQEATRAALVAQAAQAAQNAPPASAKARMASRAQPADESPVAEDAEQLAMSTLSFQDYVRERMLRRRHEALEGGGDAAFAARTQADAPRLSAGAAPAASQLAQLAQQLQAASAKPKATAQPTAPAAPRVQHALPFVKDVIHTRNAAPAAPVAAAPAHGIADELQAMREMIEERFNTMAWLGQARQDPIQSNLMLKLIRSGYSPGLARAMLERLPADMSAGDAVRWIVEVLERNLRTDAQQQPLYAQGGIYALVGATGVGKTTTAAKLAAHCVQQHGAASVGLITLDTYRVGAHDQLRAYGRMLGVVAHLAHDRAALQDLLGLLANKKMVLVDTTGVAPRDPRKQSMLDVLDVPGVNRLLVVNAGGHGDTLDDVMSSFKTSGVQQAILSKVDEAVKLGPALDATVRHQLLLRGVCNGQRVPEDFERADAAKLVAASMRSSGRSAYDPKALDLSFYFTPAGEAAQRSGAAHA
jgi:flagellar biosynthesis protein FlhF